MTRGRLAFAITTGLAWWATTITIALRHGPLPAAIAAGLSLALSVAILAYW